MRKSAIFSIFLRKWTVFSIFLRNWTIFSIFLKKWTHFLDFFEKICHFLNFLRKKNSQKKRLLPYNRRPESDDAVQEFVRMNCGPDGHDTTAEDENSPELTTLRILSKC